MEKRSSYKSVNSFTKNLIDSANVDLEINLGEVLSNRGISQTELSILTGLRQASINDLIHNRKNSINKYHLLAIMVVLNITDLTELISVKFNDESIKSDMDESRKISEGLGLTPDQEEFIRERKKELEK
jgi:transcriptional regulator with XRE-family HTH domain